MTTEMQTVITQRVGIFFGAMFVWYAFGAIVAGEPIIFDWAWGWRFVWGLFAFGSSIAVALVPKKGWESLFEELSK